MNQDRMVRVMCDKSLFAILISFMLLIGSSQKSNAQYYSVGVEPTGVKWGEMRYKDFSVIFPLKYKNFDIQNSEGDKYRKLVNKYLGNLEYYYGGFFELYHRGNSNKYTYGLPRIFPTVLHPFNASSNGVTVWAPRQIDFFMLPPTGISYPQPWHEQLAIHEGRHAWQIAHFNSKFLKVLYWVFGDQVIGGASGIYPSTWMLEGDAVVAETELTRVGRGRSASFLGGTLRAIQPQGENIVEGVEYKTAYSKNRSWDRWRFGSVKYYSPNVYEVGHMINAMARYKSKDYLLTDKILDFESGQLLNVNVVANAFKDFSGHTHREYTKDSLLQEYYSLNTNLELKSLLASMNHGNSTKIATKAERRSGANSGYYAEFVNITELTPDSLVAVASGYGTSPYLVLLTRQNESWNGEILRYMPHSQSGFSTYKGRKIFWSEPVQDARWEQVVRNKIFSYDIKERKIESIEVGNDYLYSPMNCNDTLYAISYSPLNIESSIVAIKDLNSGEILYNKEGYVKYKTDAQISEICSLHGMIYFTAIDKNGVSVKNVKDEILIDGSPHTIKEIIGGDDKLFFVSDAYNSDLLFSIDPTVRNLTFDSPEIKIATATEGITTFSVAENSGRLYVTKFDGEQGAFVYKEELEYIEPLKHNLQRGNKLADILTDQYVEWAEANLTSKKTNADESDDLFKVSEYSKFKNLFRVHSWAPLYIDVNSVTSGSFDDFYSEAKLGATIFSQNTLGTLYASAGYSYDHNSDLHSAHAKISYRGLYPIIEGSLHFNDKEMINTSNKSLRSLLNTYIPLNFSSNGWFRGITPQLYWKYSNYEVVADPIAGRTDADGKQLYNYRSINRHYVVGALSAYSSLGVAKSQIFPRWGIGARVQAGFSPNGKDRFGEIYSAYLYGYLPGLRFNQAMRLSLSYQHQNYKRYLLDNIVALPRGYVDDIFGKEYIRTTADYAIPIYLGDISLGPIAYLKSVNIVPFADLGFFKNGSNSSWRNRSSYGADVIFDAHLLRIGYPMNIGFRYARTTAPTSIKSYYKHNYVGSSNKNYLSLIMEFTLK